MGLLANQRREQIIKLLREDGSAKVIDLAKIFKVSEVTIRQDLEKLEAEDLIIREHGGAFLKNVRDQVQSFSLMNTENMDKKELIGKKAAELIENGDVIILDSGSTTTEVAKSLKGRKNLTIITNALNIGLMLGTEPGIDIMMTGGEFKPPTLSLTGQKAADFLVDIHVNKLILAHRSKNRFGKQLPKRRYWRLLIIVDLATSELEAISYFHRFCFGCVLHIPSSQRLLLD